MSDFLFARARQPDGRLAGILEHYLAPVTARVIERQGAWGSLAVAVCAHDDDGVLHEGSDGITVLCGEPILRTEHMRPGVVRGGERRARVGGLVARPDTDWHHALDGPFALLVIDPASDAATVVTDLLASIPVFSSGEFIGTHVDAVALAADRAGDTDAVSIVELLSLATVTWPHTIYRGVEQLPPASVIDLLGSNPPLTYWTPAEDTEPASLRDAAHAVRDALRADVHIVCEADGVDRLGVGVLLSGGEDSRAVLGAVPDGIARCAFVYAESENREVRLARRAARAYGAPLELGLRRSDHYLANLEAMARLVGSQHRFLDVHGYRLATALGLDRLPVVLGGYAADSLLKAHYAPVADDDAIRVPPLAGIRPELIREAEARRRGHLERLRAYRPTSAAEWTRLWPLSMLRGSANLHGNRRLFRIHEPFLGNSLVTLGSSIPQSWKRHRRVYHRATRPLLARSWYVPHIRSFFPWLGRWANLPAGALLNAQRKISDRIGGRPHQVGWALKGRMADDPAAAALLASWHPARSAVGAIFEDATPDAIDGAIRGWPARSRLQLIQLAHLTANGAS